MFWSAFLRSTAGTVMASSGPLNGSALVVAFAVAVTAAHGGDGALIADSLAEFSSGQGGANWHYGWYAASGDAGSFTELCCHDAGGQYGPWWERSPTQPPWNLIWADGQQPDDAPTVRRWVSEVSGAVRVDITTDHWPGELGAKTIQLLNNGSVLYERALGQGTGGLLTESVIAVVSNGGFLDLAVSADGEPAGDATLIRAEIYRLAAFPPTVSASSVLDVVADPGLCTSSFVPVEPTATGSCQDGAIVITGSRDDGLALDDPYPVGITRLEWTIDEMDCPNDPLTFEQWILVRADGCPDCNGNGQPDDCVVHNVTQDALYLTVQGAIDNAQEGDEIVVPPGSYHETVDLAGKQIVLRSSGGAQATVIDILGMDDSVVRSVNGEGPGTVLDGFTITGSGHGADGGGLHIFQSSPTVRSCWFRGNTVGGKGAGIYSAGDSHALISDCRFIDNAAGGHGGGLYSDTGSTSVGNSFFGGNTALRGAGVYLQAGLESQVYGCVFSGNTAPEGAGAWIGMFDDNAVVTVTSCTFSGNMGGLGDGMYILAGCGPRVDVVNCILWNQDVIDPGCWETHVYTHNDGIFPAGSNNINADPMFADHDGADDVPGSEDDDLQLLPGSPCLDAGHNWPIARLTDVDLAGNPRFADSASVDTGCGVPVVVDIGAYEQPGSPFPVSFGDIDGDGAVGITDFLAILGAWGPCSGPCCPADLDLDGDIGVTDFLALLANWD
jgi:hypothetical protein